MEFSLNSEVKLVSVMGNDLTVVNAARVSLNKHKEVLDESDEKLISYLATHKHWTPFSHPQITFRISMPIAIARQWFKSTVGLTRNEVSRRYVSDEPEYFVPDQLRPKDKSIKQGSKQEEHPLSSLYLTKYQKLVSDANELYLDMIKEGICAEQSRFILPQCTMTSFYETGSLYAYSRIINLRNKTDAQKEIQDIAKQVFLYTKELFPLSINYLCQT